MSKPQVLEISRPEMRHRRAMSLCSVVLRILDEQMTKRGMQENKFLRDVHDALMDAFMAEGVEILTDHDRERMGLSPRGTVRMDDRGNCCV